MELSKLQNIIHSAWENRAELNSMTAPPSLKEAVEQVISALESGELRVATPTFETHQWEVHLWIKQAVMLYFRLKENELIDGEFTHFYDKVPLQFSDYSSSHFQKKGARIVPPATIRRGAYIASNTILMPSYVNIGAHIGSGTLIDTWATVGSCAQIGKNVHLSGGAGIGGVLEPLQASPTIIEDDCFIGARSEIVEGVVVEKGAVISMGVFIGQSTRIYDRENDTIMYGRVPAGAVVVPGSLPSKDGKCHLNTAIIVKRVDEQTRQKVSLNELLRDPVE
ncbi:MAG: 2,3,4,5-tetrahydropyridine-2,6-dicarboxylate N-succinyltransferase [Gammaproteobacteria bacterium]